MAKDTEKLNISFAGCGFLGIYHIGVAACLQKYASAGQLSVDKLFGASAGAMTAVCLLCDAPMGQVAKEILNIATVTRARALGPFSPSFNISKVLREGLERIFPEDAHLRVNGRVHISLTRLHDRKNVTVSQFESREELLEAIMCSSFVPFFSGMVPPTYRGVRYVDGGFTDNCPVLDEHTVTVAPFCGESDICPKDEAWALMQVSLCNTSIELSAGNAVRVSRTLFPPSAEYLAQVCEQGYRDACRYLAQRELTMAVTVQNGDGHGLPDTMHSMFQNVIDAGTPGRGLYSHKSVRLLSLAALPAVLPADLAYATTAMALQTLPRLAGHFWGLSGAVARLAMESLISAKSRSTSTSYSATAKLSCQIEITEHTTLASIHHAHAAGQRRTFDFGLIVASILL